MTPTVDHNPPAHHAIAIGIGSIIRATVCVVGSSAKAEPKRKSRRKAPAPTAAPPSAAMPATAVPTAPSCIGRRGKRRRDSDDCDGGCSAPRFLPDGPLDPERPATVQRPARPQASLVSGRSLRCRRWLPGARERPLQDRTALDAQGGHHRWSSRCPRALVLVLGRSGAYAVPDTHAEMHDSLTGLWWLADVLLKRHYNWARQKWERRPNLGRRRTIPPSSLIHESAYRRGGDYARRLPPDAIPTS